MKITRHTELEVFQRAFEAAMRVFELTQKFPREEMYSLTDQIRRSSRSVAANITEAWRKRRYEGAFVSKLSNADTEAAETQTWLQFAFRCGYLKQTDLQAMEEEYEIILRMLVAMMANAGKWTLSRE
ncbi:MAG: four helix bundle protein [Verrucomicrobiaceae bacterium]|nr:four helix bundle protein [Verrucomicrobiaceae bacterium]